MSLKVIHRNNYKRHFAGYFSVSSLVAGTLVLFFLLGCGTGPGVSNSSESSIPSGNLSSGTVIETLSENTISIVAPESTLPEPESVEPDKILFSFTVSGDNRPDDDFLPQPDVFKKIIEIIKDKNPVFHITTGDIINGQTKESEIIKRQFKDYTEATGFTDIPNYIACGNHDVANNTSRKYFFKMINKAVFSESILKGIPVYIPLKSGNSIIIDTPDKLKDVLNEHKKDPVFYYYFKYDDVYFIILDAFEKGCWGAINSDQLKWLESVLKKLENNKVFVFIHTPVYSLLNPETITDGSKHVSFSNKKNLNYIREIFSNYKVDAVFSGHEHVYNKQYHDGTTYIINGLSGEYPFFPEEEGGFNHFINVEVKKENWIFYVIDSENNVRYTEEIQFN
jgi:hypothetical protein